MLETEPELIKNYVDTGKVRLIAKHFPLPSHDRADEAAEAAECAAQQGAFWEMHHLLFETVNDWSQASDLSGAFQGYASDLGIDAALFRQCLDNGEGRERWQTDLALGQSAGVTGTPTLFVFNPGTQQGTRLPGFVEFAQLAEIIDQVLSAPPAGG